MEGFTQFCIWFLFASLVIEIAWKGWKKYIEDKEEKELKEKELEEENKNKD
mgnify:CR=1 FL=1